MPQLSLYLTDSEMDSLREGAARFGMSLSRYARRVFNEEGSTWPEGYWSVYGALKDESFTVPEALDESFDRPLPSFDEEVPCISSMPTSA